MEESIRRVLATQDDQLLELYVSMTKAAQVVNALYGEITMTSVVEEALQNSPRKYGLEDLEHAYMTLHQHRLI